MLPEHQYRPQRQSIHIHAEAVAVLLCAPLLWLAPGLVSVYLANARAKAFLQLSFWLPTKLSTVTAIARSISCAEQYSDRRILQKASLMRMMASR